MLETLQYAIQRPAMPEAEAFLNSFKFLSQLESQKRALEQQLQDKEQEIQRKDTEIQGKAQRN